MRTAPADGASAAGHRFRFEKNGVEIRKIIEFESRDFLSDETFDRL